MEILSFLAFKKNITTKGQSLKFSIRQPSHSGTARHSQRHVLIVIVYKPANAQLSPMRRIASQLS